jgi:hypothetical protein
VLFFLVGTIQNPISNMKIRSCLNLFLGFSLGGLFSVPLASAQDARTPVVLDSVLFDTVEVPLLGNSLESSGTSSLTPIEYPPLNLGSFDIVITPTGMTQPAIDAFNRAAVQWEQYIGDSITVRINAALAALDPGILGGATVQLYTYPYASLRTAMTTDAADEGTNDSIVASLPTSAQLQFYKPVGMTQSSSALISRANALALGIAVPDVPDASITFSTAYSYDYDNSNGVPDGYIDFETLAAHEIGHALGFFSSVDYINAGLMTDITLSPLDLFRFRDGSSNDPTSTADFSTFLRDLVPGSAGSQPIFDDLGTEIMMSSGRNDPLYPVFVGRDGNQASHWKDNLSLGLMDPTLAYAEISRPNANDLRALDLIGYEINFSPVPEVSTLCSGVLLALGAFRRRRNPRKASE